MLSKCLGHSKVNFSNEIIVYILRGISEHTTNNKIHYNAFYLFIIFLTDFW